MKTESEKIPKIGVLLEQTLGHVSHGRNLKDTLTSTTDAVVACRELPFEPQGLADKLPPFSNWTVRSSLAARSAVRSLEKSRPLDALFVHTHVPATLLGSTMERVPTVVSIDATPKQIDSLGGSYKHAVHSDMVESAKYRMHASCFQKASSMVAWSKWAADSLVNDYGVNREQIEVVPPGVVRSQWLRSEPRRMSSNVVRILFVGGDFDRKGGTILLEAVSRLRQDPEVIAQGIEVELHLVTSADVAAQPGVTVYQGLTPNCPELIELFHTCDVFALPTMGDCTPVVLAEAASAGLPSVATSVGAIGESVLDGVTGHLIEPNVESLMAGLRRLVVDTEHRLKLGENALQHSADNMDAEKNALRLLDGLLESASKKPTNRTVLTVSGNIPAEINDSIEAGLRPLADYVAISEATDASLLDWSGVRAEASSVTNAIRRLGGNSLAMAYHLYRQRQNYEVIITDGEQVGLPLAALLRLSPRRSTRHVMIGHKLSPPKKAVPAKALGLAARIDDILVYSTSQLVAAQEIFGSHRPNIRLIDFMVDTEFFRPSRQLEIERSARRPLVVTAGREYRDYPTFIEAVRGLDVDVVIASASPWSRRSDNAHDVELPENVVVTALTQRELRDLLDEADMMVMPLMPSDFQAGITTILEAMSMERPVICTATAGQTDVIEEDETGFYVPPGDIAAMRGAIERLVADPEAAASMGKRGRILVEKRADVRLYAEVFDEVVGSHRVRVPGLELAPPVAPIDGRLQAAPKAS